MNHYQITGIIILVVVIVLAGLTFWPTATTPSTAVAPTAATTGTTQKSVTAPAAKPTTLAGAGARTFEKGVYVTTVFYTATGFVPTTINAAHGEEVRFINKSSGVMHVIADEKLSSGYYKTVNQGTTVGKGGVYQVSLNEPGLLSFYNLNGGPRQNAQVYVK